MPKLACPCGFVQNLSSIPDDGWRAIRDKDMEAYIEHERVYSDGFNAPEGSPERASSDISGRETLRMETLLCECPQCGRIMWRKARGEKFHIYLPEDEVTQAQALALAAAADFQQEQEKVRAEAIRIHNEAACLVAQRMPSDGLRCPHCLEFSKQMQFIERLPHEWSFFQCPACARTFRLERFKQLRDDETKG
jgi:transposase-like protein